MLIIGGSLLSIGSIEKRKGLKKLAKSLGKYLCKILLMESPFIGNRALYYIPGHSVSNDNTVTVPH